VKDFYPGINEPQRFVDDHLDITNPYGTLGKLSRSRSPGFGDVSSDYADEAVQNIRTYTEGLADASRAAYIGSLIDKAEQIVFLVT
jgi:hypothetical protein